MATIQWNKIGDRLYEAGVDRGVLYLNDSAGVPWNGLLSVDDKSVGDSPASYYADGAKFLVVASPTDFEATIQAFTYPEEFEICDGTQSITDGLKATQQPQQEFGLSYRTGIGSDLDDALGYKIHLIYNALATPSEKAYVTKTDDPSAMTFQWDITTTPDPIVGFRPTAHVVIDSTAIKPNLLVTIENILYGTDDDPPTLISLQDLVTFMQTNTEITIVDNGDGTWSATGPSDLVYLTDPTTFEIDQANATYIDDDTYQISST